MKRRVDTSTLTKGEGESGGSNLPPPSEGEIAQLYNGLDCCLTTEIFEEITSTYKGSREVWGPHYDFHKALQAPYLDMMLRGFAVDSYGRGEEAGRLRGRIGELTERFQRIVEGGFSHPRMNPASTTQLKYLFYELLHLPEVWVSVKGVRHIAVNREALEKLADSYVISTPLINLILTIRDLTKQLEVLECDLDFDGRFRAGYNIAGTETGRPSSAANAFGNGRNAQNIDPGLRHVFQADKGCRMGQVDLEQVEARDVGFICGVLFSDWGFLDACEGGDLHTSNAKRIWPGMGWTGNRDQDKKLAESNFYREFSYRDMAKRGSHLSNYMGSAWTAARSLKVPLSITEEFQARYCRGGRLPSGEEISPAYPCIPRWWQWVITELQTKGKLSNLFGFTRTFLGRPNDPATHREGIAFQPQSTTGQRMNLGMWRVWKKEPRVGLLAQNFDSIVFQYEDRGREYENDIISSVLDLIRVKLVAPTGRMYAVPGEAKVGWNWGTESPTNPDGLRKWSEGREDPRGRVRFPGIMGGG